MTLTSIPSQYYWCKFTHICWSSSAQFCWDMPQLRSAVLHDQCVECLLWWRYCNL